MNKIKLLSFLFILSIASIIIISSDHIDYPAVSGSTADVADLYVFESRENTNNMIFALTMQGLLSPGNSATAKFDENVLIEFNIDNDGDFVEDLVIQGIPRDNKMILFGPYPPNMTGLKSEINTNVIRMEVDITAYGNTPVITNQNGMKLFAGPRDDPFFFDLGAYMAIVTGNAGSFNDPGTDTSAGTNVLALVVEVPKSMLGSSSTINVWVETKTKF